MHPHMHLDGKLKGRRQQLNAIGGLTFLTDDVTGTRFLADTGAAVSVLPHTPHPAFRSEHGPALAGADGKPIASWGVAHCRLSFGGRIFDNVPFVLAAVSKPILGADFFATHRLLIDTASCCVLDALTLTPLVVPDSPGRHSGFVASLNHVSVPIRSLLARYPAIIGDGTASPRPLHGVEHSIETTGRPIFAKARRLDPDKHRIVEAEFQKLEHTGIVQRSNSSWASLLTVFGTHVATATS